MTGPQIIVLATPVFLALIGLELAVGRRRGRNTYRLNDALSSIGLGVLSQVAGLFTALLTLGIYSAAYAGLAPWRLPVDSPWTWLGALVAYDFLYYWHHRAGHRIAVFWAAHVVHHQSEDYNLSTALRQTSSGWLFGWVFYLPMALAGVPPLVFGVVALIDLLYQFWVHTEQVGRLGWFDRWFCAPSNHRVHHAVNDAYLDKNYGGILILWDRLFGTYAAEDPAMPCVYGTRGPLRSWNPIRANLQVYAGLARDAWRTRRLVDKAAVWLKPPGWRPPDLAAADPRPAFDIAAVERFDTVMSKPVQALALAIFVGLLAGTSWLLWNAHRLAWPVQAGAAATILLGLWILGRVSEGSAAGARERKIPEHVADGAPDRRPSPAAGRS